MPREKVLATVVRLLEETRIRIGNDEYRKENGSYGLTTLRDRHVNVIGAEVRFSFRGKSGKHHIVELHDRRVCPVDTNADTETINPGRAVCQRVQRDGNRLIRTLQNPALAAVEKLTASDAGLCRLEAMAFLATRLAESCLDGRQLLVVFR